MCLVNYISINHVAYVPTATTSHKGPGCFQPWPAFVPSAIRRSSVVGGKISKTDSLGGEAEAHLSTRSHGRGSFLDVIVGWCIKLSSKNHYIALNYHAIPHSQSSYSYKTVVMIYS
jgi:hypothetical protein